MPTSQNSSPHPTRMLIVDDDAPIYSSLEAIFRREGYDVFHKPVAPPVLIDRVKALLQSTG